MSKTNFSESCFLPYFRRALHGWLIIHLISSATEISAHSMSTKINHSSIDYSCRKSSSAMSGIETKGEVNVSKETCNSLSGCTAPWQYCDNGTCQCGDVPSNYILQCEVGKNLTVLSYYCATVDQSSCMTEVGMCLFWGEIDKSADQYIPLPNTLHDLHGFLCDEDLNRTGTLCGKCKDGHYPLVYSFDMNCVECPNGKSNWWKFLLAAFLPLTIFYFVVVLFKINVTSSHLQGFVYFCQGIAMPVLARVYVIYLAKRQNFQQAGRCIGSLFSIWNLDFLRFFKLEICLGTNTLQTLSLDLAVGIYPLLLMTLTYLLIKLYDSNFKPLVIIWKPFKGVLGIFKRNWEIKTSLIDAFATFFLLSNMKFLSASFDLLAPVSVYQLNSTGHLTHSWRLYYNASVPYFGETHLPYAILAITVLTLFVLLPTLLLIIYPFHWFQKLSKPVPLSLVHPTHLHGCIPRLL